jgi:tRNA-specific 2-thiouridylase
MGIPLYVIGKDVEKNQLIVGPVEMAKKKTFFVEDLHWICDSPDFPLETKVRIRNLGSFYEAKVSVFNKGILQIDSKEEIFGVAPGQSAVFYQKGCVLGGGIISG